MTNQGNTVLYTGVTNDLLRRAYEHKAKLVPGFTRRYNVDRLVYYEACDRVEEAILGEKRIKGGSRAQKIRLIESMNQGWHDLYEGLLG